MVLIFKCQFNFSQGTVPACIPLLKPVNLLSMFFLTAMREAQEGTANYISVFQTLAKAFRSPGHPPRAK